MRGAPSSARCSSDATCDLAHPRCASSGARGSCDNPARAQRRRKAKKKMKMKMKKKKKKKKKMMKSRGGGGRRGSDGGGRRREGGGRRRRREALERETRDKDGENEQALSAPPQVHGQHGR